MNHCQDGHQTPPDSFDQTDGGVQSSLLCIREKKRNEEIDRKKERKERQKKETERKRKDENRTDKTTQKNPALQNAV